MEKKVIYVSWTPSLSIGNQKLDDQHKSLMDLINFIYIDIINDTPTYLTDHYMSLVEYTKQHFLDEEKYLQKYDYPHFNTHKATHDRMILETERIIEQFKKFEASNESLTELLGFVKDWWINHVTIMDKEYAKYISNKKSTE